MFYKLIIVIIFILILLYFKNKKTETWTKLQEDNYFDNFNKYDLEFRGCKSKEHCKQKYIEKVLPFTPEEEIVIIKIIENFNELINHKYRDIFREINFIKVDNEIESSMPHTRGSNIILSKNWISNMINKYKQNRDDTFFPKLLAHEQFHIFQRHNKKMMDDLYQNYWELVKYNKKLPEEILKINRTNPDALPNINWLFKVEDNLFILPLCVYSKNSQSLRDTQNIYVRFNGRYEIIDLEDDLKNRKLLVDLDAFKIFFGSESANNYHPNELASSLFEIMIEEEISKNKIEKPKALILLENFFRNNIK